MRPLLAASTLLASAAILLSQTPPALPSWLSAYPGANPTSQTSPLLIQSTYTTPARFSEVLEHYRKLFEAANVRWLPNSDGVGVVSRGETAECDLLIKVRQQASRVFVEVNCAVKSPAESGEVGRPVEIVAGRASSAPGSRTAGARALARPSSGGMPSVSEMQANHERRVAELGIHPTYHDAPAPPLDWPSWLVHIKGAAVTITKGVDQSRKAYLKARYVTSTPMSEIHDFYEDLLNTNEYRVHTAKLSTGQTISGVVQNAWGFVEGTNYPDGAPGPRTVIHVSFTRSKLNEPITVEMRLTAYEFVAPRGF